MDVDLLLSCDDEYLNIRTQDGLLYLDDLIKSDTVMFTKNPRAHPRSGLDAAGSGALSIASLSSFYPTLPSPAPRLRCTMG